jgi:hypothetical protein
VVAAIGNCNCVIDYRGKTPETIASGLRLITTKYVKPRDDQAGIRSVDGIGFLRHVPDLVSLAAT